MPHKSSFSYGVGVLVLAAALLSAVRAQSDAAADDAPVEALIPVPPEPEGHFKEGMSPEERREEHKRWTAERRAWAERLTKEQKAELKRRRAEQHRRSQEKWAKRERLPVPADGYDWRVNARAMKLSDADVEQLSRDKLVYGPSVKQSFDPYLAGPVFITSDSILNGFHVLFEESFREAEERSAYPLRSNLEIVLDHAKANLKESPFAAVETAPAMRHAQLVLGPALVLLGSPLERFDPEVRDEISRQTAKIRASEAVELPEWLGPESPTLLRLDYRRMKPVGFYAADPRLADYFRAVRWLQMIPFRADRTVELGAIAMLGYGLNRAYDTPASEFFRRYDDFLGRRDGSGLDSASYVFQNFFRARDRTDTWATHLRRAQQSLLLRFVDWDEYPAPTIDDRLPPEVENRLPEMQYRILVGHVLPDSVMLQELARKRLPPQGAAVAAMLGSEFARTKLTGIAAGQVDDAERTTETAASADHRNEHSLYEDYFDVLRATQRPLAPEAPDLFRSKAWEAKSCQTLLASWAQMRHAFTLQATQSAFYAGLTIAPPGFVEPDPEFFSKFASMVERATDLFEARGCFSSSAQLEAERLRSDGEFIEASESREWSIASSADCNRYENLLGLGEQTEPPIPGWTRSRPARGAPETEWASFRRDLAAALRAAADRYERHELAPPDRHSVVRDRWQSLERLARRLEALAHKQLRRQPWSEAESAFLKSYGKELAFVMGYYGNSYLASADDAPRWTEIHREPAADRMLAVGVGRPRVILVLYPWDGMEILCRGSVMPYYEYHTSERLTDKEWLHLLDSEQAPPLPEWMATYMKPRGLEPESHR